MSNADALVGHLVDGRYEVVRKLARGGMATVYLAHDLRLTRTVAIKIMHDNLGSDADFVSRFDREARSAARLSHPNVVAVFDQGTDSGRPYIVMEYVEGSTLRHVITRESPMPPQRALDLMLPIAAAVAAAHEAGIIHRDLKPENVLLNSGTCLQLCEPGTRCRRGSNVRRNTGVAAVPACQDFVRTFGADRHPSVQLSSCPLRWRCEAVGLGAGGAAPRRHAE